MDEWQKQRYKARGECIADIVGLIDHRADNYGLVEYNEITRYLASKIREYSDKLSQDDVEGITGYIDTYLGIVMNTRNIPVNGYFISRKRKKNMAKQFQGNSKP